MRPPARPPAVLLPMRQVLARVPIRDWVVAAAPDELHEYGGLSAAQFFAQREFEVRRRAAAGAAAAATAAACLAHPPPT